MTQRLLAACASYRYWHFHRDQSSDPHFRVMRRTTPTALEMLPENDTETGPSQ